MRLVKIQAKTKVLSGIKEGKRKVQTINVVFILFKIRTPFKKNETKSLVCTFANKMFNSTAENLGVSMYKYLVANYNRERKLRHNTWHVLGTNQRK